jgi:uncharacterized protein with HEPN domain
MPPREWRLRIADILGAIAAIQSYTQEMDYEMFIRDRRTVDAVLRNLTVIGEAATYVPDDIVALHPEVPWREMRDMRNVVVHAYFGVNQRIVWDTIQLNLPPLVALLEALQD